jgi:hypothetical protein
MCNGLGKVVLRTADYECDIIGVDMFLRLTSRTLVQATDADDLSWWYDG